MDSWVVELNRLTQIKKLMNVQGWFLFCCRGTTEQYFEKSSFDFDKNHENDYSWRKKWRFIENIFSELVLQLKFPKILTNNLP